VSSSSARVPAAIGRHGATIKRVLVANRGEIAVRIIRACRDLGIETVQVYSEPDAQSLAVKLADVAIGIGPASARESYLNQPALISAAILAGCDAIHPGYGFLAENPTFAELCRRKGFMFIGPQPEVIRMMGDKAEALAIARRTGVPTIPGSDGLVADSAQARAVAGAIGYPMLLKASGGGGGKGMRIVADPASLEREFTAAQSEARSAFGDPRLYIERYLTDIRHVEVQIVGDGRDVVHLGERDCTIQRRHQKLIEETPSPALDPRLRGAMTGAAVRLTRDAGYTSVGTVEFVLDNRTREFFFIEMNTRLQVEHPVTELVSGIDLVEEQIRIAAGAPLSFSQGDVSLSGCAIECRINAESAARGFAPQPGTITGLRMPAGPWVRVDTHAVAGCTIPPFYDSLIAKLIVYGSSRAETIARMQRALDEIEITGIETNVDLHRRIMASPRFQAGAFSTRFLDELLGESATMAVAPPTPIRASA
jgi:acetyl-CoA carboxylase biotin carboxylase subunit